MKIFNKTYGDEKHIPWNWTGKVIIRDTNGKIKFEYNEKDGNPVGAHFEYYPSGKLKEERKYDENGNKCGPTIHYYENGNKRRIINYNTSGKRHGLTIDYDKKGNIECKRLWVRGEWAGDPDELKEILEDL